MLLAASIVLILGLSIKGFMRWRSMSGLSDSLSTGESLPGSRQVYLEFPTTSANRASSSTGIEGVTDETVDNTTSVALDFSGLDTAKLKPFEVIADVHQALACAEDATNRRLYLSYRDGAIQVVSTETGQVIARAMLDAPAYHLLVDEKGQKLVAASIAPGSLRQGIVGEKEYARVHFQIYDLKKLSGADSSPALQPVKTLKYDFFVGRMIFSEDRRKVYFVAEEAGKVRVGEILVDDWTMKIPFTVKGTGPIYLSRGPDEKTLLFLAGGRLLSIDPSTWKFRQSLSIGGTVHAVETGASGKVYLLERRVGVRILVLDMASRRFVSRWIVESEGKPAYCVSSDRKHLFLSVYGVSAGRILGIDISEDQSPWGKPWGIAESNRQRFPRGELSISENKSLLFSGSGQIFRTGL